MTSPGTKSSYPRPPHLLNPSEGPGIDTTSSPTGMRTRHPLYINVGLALFRLVRALPDDHVNGLSVCFIEAKQGALGRGLCEIRDMQRI